MITCAAGAIIVAADSTGHFAIALGVGILVGALFFMLAAVNGGGMRPTGLAAPHLMTAGPQKPSDPRAGIGCALAASGIASSAAANAHYPFPFRVFYAACIAAGVLIALFQAWRSRNSV